MGVKKLKMSFLHPILLCHNDGRNVNDTDQSNPFDRWQPFNHSNSNAPVYN